MQLIEEILNGILRSLNHFIYHKCISNKHTLYPIKMHILQQLYGDTVSLSKLKPVCHAELFQANKLNVMVKRDLHLMDE